VTTASGIDAKVLAAFQVEYREQLERMRSLRAEFEPGADLRDDPRIREAFRLAHSFKGGARVCGLRPAEQLGHALESLLETLASGHAPWTTSFAAAVERILDSIEDWMVAFERHETPPDVTNVLAGLSSLIEPEPNRPEDGGQPAAVPREWEARLRATFDAECRENLERIVALMETFKTAGDAAATGEAVRLAHSLAGAARIVGCDPISASAGVLEATLRETAQAGRAVDAESLALIERELGAIRGALARTEETQPSAHAEAHPAFALPTEYVRVSVASLEPLMRSAGRLQLEAQRHEQLADELEGLRDDAEELDRWQESIRRAAATGRDRPGRAADFANMLRGMEGLDRQIYAIARRARRLCLAAERSAWQLRSAAGQIDSGLREVRMVPAESVFHGLRKMVRDIARDEGKNVALRVTGLDVRADRLVLQALKDPLMHMLRNSVTHGIEPPHLRRERGKPPEGTVTLVLRARGNQLEVTVDDDGRGIDFDRLARRAVERGFISAAAAERSDPDELANLVFEPGLSTSQTVTELAGRGMGLAIVLDAVRRLQGQVQLVPRTESGSCFRILVPTSVSTHRLLLVACGANTFAVPLRAINRLLRVKRSAMETIAGRHVVTCHKQPIAVTRLADLLGLCDGDLPETFGVMVLNAGTRRRAVAVDAFEQERDLMVQSLDALARRREFSGAVLLEDGRVALVLDPSALGEAPHAAPSRLATRELAAAARRRVLVVDDSFTTRTLEKTILEAHGYQVEVAVDGAEALARLQCEEFDVVVSDIEMPKVDGFALLERVKSDRRLKELPVLLVTSRDRQEDRVRGLDLGAQGYIVKRKFDHQDLLNTIAAVI
jgi:two-component system chemotaxis sensor kinase CheA